MMERENWATTRMRRSEPLRACRFDADGQCGAFAGQFACVEPLAVLVTAAGALRPGDRARLEVSRLRFQEHTA